MTDLLTLHLDPNSQALFEAMRQRHFPTERNQVPAHLSLFHTLPQSPEILEILARAGQIEPFPLTVTGLRSLGKGVAYTLTAPPLLTLHRHLAEAFARHLTPQDRQKFQPHIVIQNKATVEAARNLLAQLQPAFTPFEIQALGLDLWHYRNGPWTHAQTFPFKIP